MQCPLDGAALTVAYTETVAEAFRRYVEKRGGPADPEAWDRWSSERLKNSQVDLLNVLALVEDESNG